MKRYVALTDTDRAILESYKAMLNGLAEYLGSGYEIVLHSLEDLDCSAIKVINGHYTGRREGAPITNLAMEMLSKIKESDDQQESMVYFNRDKRGAPVRSATIPISGSEGKLIGLLCINFYMDIPLCNFIDSLKKIHGPNDIMETYAATSDELIDSVLEAAKTQVMNDVTITASNRNKAIIALLYQKDIFNLKDAVIKVANRLGISKNTVYLHLRNLGE